MKLADSNVWLALALSQHAFHRAAEDWFAKITAKGEVLFCRSTQQSFLRLLTTAAVLNPYGNPPLSNAEAWALLDRFLVDKRVACAEEPPNVSAYWKKLGAERTVPQIVDGCISRGVRDGGRTPTCDDGCGVSSL